MASIAKQQNGRKRLSFFDQSGDRKYIRLGKMDMKQAIQIKAKVEDLIGACIAGHTPLQETLHWMSEQRKNKTKLIEKLADLGLIQREYRPSVPDTLGAFITKYIESRTDVKDGTLITYRQVLKRLVDYFGEERRLLDITAGEAKEWRRWLLEKGLAGATVNRSCSTARQYFNEAIDYKVIDSNPLVGLPTVVRGNHEKFHFIDRDTIAKVIEACPNAEWRLLVGLARYGGLRIPSEVVKLRWGDIDWANETFTVTSPKTEHHEGKGTRVVPIFPALLPLLQEAFDMAEEGTEYVVQRFGSSDNREVNTTQNLRTHFQRIIRKAGVEPWVKLWQNLRSSRATELAEKYPEHVLTKWLGNTPKVAKEHYLQVTDEHWKRAVLAESTGVQGGTECAPVLSGLGMNRTAQGFSGKVVSVGGATRNTHTPKRAGARDGRDRIRTCEGVRQQIYSLPPLSTWVLALFN